VTPETLNEALIRKYLLGTLSPEDRERIEDAYFADGEALEAVVAAENDLIDSYVRGGLTDEERRYFAERYKASPDMTARVGFARALAHVVESENNVAAATPASLWNGFSSLLRLPRPQIAWAFAGVAVLVAISLLSLQNYSLQKEIRDARAEATRIRQENGTLRSQIAALNDKPQLQEGGESNQLAKLEPPADFSFRLVPGATRSSTASNDLVLPRNGGSIRLELVLDRDDFRSYEAVLQTADGKNVLQAKGLKSSSVRGNRVVFLRLTASSIQPGDYAVRLRGEKDDGSIEEAEWYRLRSVRK
jgi:anti-sigma factor RsiW